MKSRKTTIFSIILAAAGVLYTSCETIVYNDDLAPTGLYKTVNERTGTCTSCGGGGQEWRNFDEEYESDKEAYVERRLRDAYFPTPAARFQAEQVAAIDFSNANLNRRTGQGYGPCRACGGSGTCVYGDRVEVSPVHIYWTR